MTSGTEPLDSICKAVVKADLEELKDGIIAAIDTGISAETIMNDGLGRGMYEVGKKFDNGEIYLPQIIASSKAMDTAVELLKPLLKDHTRMIRATVVMGTVEGDIHEIGKNICCALLRGSGYGVVDLGTDVRHMDFFSAAEENNADIIACSALMTTTLGAQKEIVRIKNELKKDVKCVVGGAPCSEEWCREIGADGYSATADGLVCLVDELTGNTGY